MSQPISYFEIHVGFPDGDRYERGFHEFTQQLRTGPAVWTSSDVQRVMLHDPGCLDPHNVPGTLRRLVSTQIANNGLNWSEVIAQQVHPACDQALALLRELDLADVRVEIEYPYGCCWSVASKRTRLFEPAVSIPARDLHFRSGVALDDVPQWEIHFVLEPGPTATELEIQQVGPLIAKYGVDIEQTIEYRSEAMIRRGEIGHKFIATSYYAERDATTREAERLFFRTGLSDEFSPYGFTLKLVLEHIVGCFRPLTPASERQPIEVQNAR